MDEAYSAGPYAISMHQPWASLLVHGVKRIEGRSWPTSFRGRLWIHATSAAPNEAVVQETVESYRSFWALEGVVPKFPEAYPTSALLGCVDVVNCLPIESIEAWPGIPESVRAEVGSPYGFLCDNPKRLVVPQKMPGSFKIWGFPGKTAREMEPALRAAPQHGKEPWTWTAYSIPEGLAAAKLPRSANRDKWQKRYGSPRSQRSKLTAPARSAGNSDTSGKDRLNGAHPAVNADRWRPLDAEGQGRETPCDQTAHAVFQAHTRMAQAQPGAAASGHLQDVLKPRSVELEAARSRGSRGGLLSASPTTHGGASPAQLPAGPWGASTGGSMADRLRSLHQAASSTGRFPQSAEIDPLAAPMAILAASTYGGDPLGASCAGSVTDAPPVLWQASTQQGGTQRAGTSLPGIRLPVLERSGRAQGSERPANDISELLAVCQPQSRAPFVSLEPGPAGQMDADRAAVEASGSSLPAEAERLERIEASSGETPLTEPSLPLASSSIGCRDEPCDRGGAEVAATNQSALSTKVTTKSGPSHSATLSLGTMSRVPEAQSAPVSFLAGTRAVWGGKPSKS